MTGWDDDAALRATGCKYCWRGVFCTTAFKKCWKCGWNPEVSERRKRKIRLDRIRALGGENT